METLIENLMEGRYEVARQSARRFAVGDILDALLARGMVYQYAAQAAVAMNTSAGSRQERLIILRDAAAMPTIPLSNGCTLHDVVMNKVAAKSPGVSTGSITYSEKICSVKL